MIAVEVDEAEAAVEAAVELLDRVVRDARVFEPDEPPQKTYKQDRQEYRTKSGGVLPLDRRETPEYRLRKYAALRLVNGVCNACGYRPYYCQSCAGLKCKCLASGVYRHWENDIPNMVLEELEWMDRLE